MLTQTLSPTDTATALRELGLDEPASRPEKSEMPFQTVIMPAFDLVDDARLESMLPQPLLDSHRLNKRFIRLIEHARTLSPTQLESMKEVLNAKGKDKMHLRNSQFNSVLLQSLEHLDADRRLADQFPKLMESFESLPSKHRKFLLEMLGELNAL